MKFSPKIRWYLYESDTPLSESDITLASALPLNRDRTARPPDGSNNPSVSYGEAFRAATRFICRDEGEALSAALTRHTGRTVTADRIEAVTLRLVKHGAFYHPFLVTIAEADGPVQAVLNLAVSRAGRLLFEPEAGFLHRLTSRVGNRFLPLPLDRGPVPPAGDSPPHPPLGALMCEWFEDFHEFHLRKQKDDIIPAVWDPRRGGRLLSPGESESVFCGAARILAYYIDLHTFEEIRAWHHAAGDFVIHLDHGAAEVRLITVREYRSGVGGRPKSDRERLSALLPCFLHLTLRMRLDREDGVGSPLLAGETAVAGAVEGFFRGISENPTRPKTDFVEDAFDYISSVPAGDLCDITRAVVDAFPQNMPELPLFRKHRDAHAEAVFAALHG